MWIWYHWQNAVCYLRRITRKVANMDASTFLSSVPDADRVCFRLIGFSSVRSVKTYVMLVLLKTSTSYCTAVCALKYCCCNCCCTDGYKLSSQVQTAFSIWLLFSLSSALYQVSICSYELSVGQCYITHSLPVYVSVFDAEVRDVLATVTLGCVCGHI